MLLQNSCPHGVDSQIVTAQPSKLFVNEDLAVEYTVTLPELPSKVSGAYITHSNLHYWSDMLRDCLALLLVGCAC